VVAPEPAPDRSGAVGLVSRQSLGSLAGASSGLRDADLGGDALEDLALVYLARRDLEGEGESSSIAKKMDLGTKPAS
jgi:hypothetical protein